ncbi:adhesion G protein-coupled receptor G3-like isoform X2 [Alosa pseudoharengus]
MYTCKVTTGIGVSVDTYILIARLKNRPCPAGKSVVFSFTSPVLAEGVYSNSISSNLTDCAINMTQPSDDACKPYPLDECVHDWDFQYFQGSKAGGVFVPVNGGGPLTSIPEVINNCSCAVIQHLLELRLEIGAIHNIYRDCILGFKDKMKDCKSLQLLERAIRNMTLGPLQRNILSLISSTVTSGDNLTSFFISLPSGDRQQSTSLDDVTMEVPPEALDPIKINSGGRLNIGAYWFKEDSLFPVEQVNLSLLRSRVVALDLGQDISGLENHVKLTFSLQNTTLVNTAPQCVFWDVKDEATATWNSSGCNTTIVKGKVICSCNHLSFFAVLLTPVGVVKPLSAASVYTLTILSRVGCSVSLAFLVLTVLTHAFYQRGPTENSLWIHLHVCVSLLLLNLTFLINDFLTALRIPAVCIAMAALTHYAELSMLTWFAIEGLHLYLLFIRVFNIHIRRYLLKLGLLGWGLPAVPVAVIVGLDLYGESKIENEEGGSTSVCFVKKDNLIPQILTYCYFLLVLLFNVTMFSVVLNQLLKARLHSPIPQDKGLNWGMVLSLLALSWMLGISWGVMTFSAIAPLQEISFYIFCTLNGLHGFFLFLRYCSLLRKEKQASSSISAAASTPQSSKSN